MTGRMGGGADYGTDPESEPKLGPGRASVSVRTWPVRCMGRQAVPNLGVPSSRHKPAGNQLVNAAINGGPPAHCDCHVEAVLADTCPYHVC